MDTPLKLLLVCAGSSSKSTLFQSLRISHLDDQKLDYSDYINVIRNNILYCINILLNECNNLYKKDNILYKECKLIIDETNRNEVKMIKNCLSLSDPFLGINRKKIGETILIFQTLLKQFGI